MPLAKATFGVLVYMSDSTLWLVKGPEMKCDNLRRLAF